MLSGLDEKPTRYVIDFHPRDVLEAANYGSLFLRVKNTVLTERENAAAAEAERNKQALDANPNAHVNRHHANFLKKWWLMSYPREELISQLAKVSRYIVCSRVTKRPIFEFVDARIRPNDALAVFPLEDDYSFGILQSSIHWDWFRARRSTLEERFRYTSDTVFDTFCWPQSPKSGEVRAVATAAVRLRKLRQKVMTANKWTLRELYRTLDEPGDNPLRSATSALDDAVCHAYGMPTYADSLEFLLALNQRCAELETQGKLVVGPGVPAGIPVEVVKVSDDRILP